ncbi:MAG TPA: hypothetical protein PK528_00075 [Syntrophorhabdus sp.]|nr:hypothetical protein [Syntrophorhabdus sp.]HQB33771.1 hypothetical protein [Syntrophorhabdus sp.]HQO61982.1 hypothetical protein [Syntrophorhabdus sp.]
MEEKKAIVQEVINILGIAPLISSVIIENEDSPWSEKAHIKWKKDHLDVKAFVWDDPTYLYGRIYRLFLYIVDVLNPIFEYKPRISPDEQQEPTVRERYNQIWSIYVDSRMERLEIENFFDKTLRKNIFIDSEKNLSSTAADTIFDALWEKESYTYPEIIEYAYDLKKLKLKTPIVKVDTFNKHITDLLHGSSVSRHLENIPSSEFRETVNDIISFAAYHCKDAFILSKYYGICILYNRQVFLELIPTGKDSLYLTIFDGQTNTFSTLTVTKETDTSSIQELIKEKYALIAKQDERL